MLHHLPTYDMGYTINKVCQLTPPPNLSCKYDLLAFPRTPRSRP